MLRKNTVTIEKTLQSTDGSIEVVPFRRGKMRWGTEWKQKWRTWLHPKRYNIARLIVARERRLTVHVAGVPRLHRALVPRRVRRTLLPRVLAQVAG